MEKFYLFLNKGIYKAVEHIVVQEKPEVGEYYFDLACAPDEDGKQLFNVKLIVDKDRTWHYGATIYNENYLLISIAKIVDGEYTLDYEIVKRETFKAMKSIESKNFTVEEALKEIHTVNELLKVENVVTIEDENGNIVDTMLKGLKDTEGNGNKLVRITKRKATRWLVVKLV